MLQQLTAVAEVLAGGAGRVEGLPAGGAGAGGEVEGAHGEREVDRDRDGVLIGGEEKLNVVRFSGL